MPHLLIRLAAGASALMLGLAAHAASFQAHVQEADGTPVKDAVISLKGPGGKAPGPAQAIMDQRAKAYLPHVLAVHTGTAVSFPNSDNIRHQVYSFSPAKRFELRLYEGTPTSPIVFDKPGIVVLGCNIHDWMLGYLYVTDDPWFAVTDAQGNASISEVPVGAYQVTAWHPQSADQQLQPQGEVRIEEAGTRHSYTLAITPLPANTPQAPAPSEFGEAFGKAVQETTREATK
ncbi:methylamine utilization protein [Pseudomonas sp. KNUC1026]|uniref:methylamine utilization protein n=1 Tax=Pseudomonas sp. KNUC1026 TaxID=2893890 RepID=UPI001F1DBE6C|nr:methylamine utilization protein [Pseudomonas sp. KNUC1026]UFH48197.1 methylamine utilization protein [Pseudomonas sp. KNUC1026]